MLTRLHRALRSCAGIALLTATLPHAALAQVADTVTSVSSGQCMDVFGGSVAAGTQIIQWGCHGGANQKWQPVASGDYYTLRAASGDRCLDVGGYSTAAGAALVQWNCTGGANQQFTLRSQGVGHALVARHSGLCVTAENGSSAQGARLVQQSCDGAASQTWVLNGLPPAALPPATALRLVSSGQCMDASGGSATAGTQIVQWGCHGGANQRWRPVASGDNYTLRVASSDQCLDVGGSSTAAGAALIQWNCISGANQQFTLRPQGAGYALVASHSGLCVGAEGGSTAVPGARLVQQACDGTASQTWVPDGMAPAAGKGQWGPVQNLSLVPVAAANLPNGRVLFWSAYARLTFGGDNGRTYTSVYDPATGSASEVLVTNTGHDMFCPGIANLPDGRIHVAGGSSATRTSIYDPSTNRWTTAAPMNIARGYQGNVTLDNGDVFTIGGSWSGGQGNKDAEVWSSATNTWRRTTAIWDDYILTADVGGVYRADNHAWLFTASGGRVFHAGPSRRMNWFNPAGNGSVTFAGNRGDDGHAMNGNAVMYDVNKILTMGGAPNYENSDATASAHVIDIAPATPAVTRVGSMAYARAFQNSVVLPDGQVLVIGGQSYPVAFSDDRAVLVPELFNPATRTFRSVAPMAQARTYHSVALLLPDGRVLSGGGGLCGGCATNHPNVQIWSPPYLFNVDGSAATRPTLTAAPTTAAAGTSISVNTGSAVTAFALVRLSSVTHSVNNEQRRVPLAFTTTGPNSYSLRLPADRGILVPGHYMLFALNAAGVPSVSRTMRIN